MSAAVLLAAVLIAVFLVINGLFVAAEFAIVGAPRTRIARLSEQGNHAAQRVMRILIEPVLLNRYIATAQVGITIVSLGLGAYGEHAVADWLLLGLDRLGWIGAALAHTLATVLAVTVLTYLHVVIGEMIPKSLALQSAEKTVLWLVGPMSIFDRLFLPFVWALNLVGNGITRLFGVPRSNGQARLFTPEELEYIVEESQEGGLIDPSDQLYIENILDLQERTVGQAMTPRPRMVSIPLTAGTEEILRLACRVRKTRYPLYDGTIDQIAGILHIKDLIRLQRDEPNRPLDLKSIARPAAFVPESLSLENLLRRSRQERFQMAIVLDEFGGTAGIVTLEDLIEEVVGEIQDEFDRETSPIEELPGNVLRVRGDLILDELNQLYDLDLDYSEGYTIGGLVMSLLGRIPLKNDRVTVRGLTLEVEAVEGLAVKRVLIHNVSTDAPD